jgi:hypothetical protein
MNLVLLNLLLMTFGPFAVLLPMAAAVRLSFAGRRVRTYRGPRLSFAALMPRQVVCW